MAQSSEEYLVVGTKLACAQKNTGHMTRFVGLMNLPIGLASSQGIHTGSIGFELTNHIGHFAG